MVQRQSGLSEVSILIGLAIVAVATVAFILFINHANSSQRLIHQKFEMLNLSQEMMASLRGVACTCMLNPAQNITNSQPLTFNLGDTLELDSFYETCDSSSPPRPDRPMASRNLRLISPRTQTGLVVRAIRFTNIAPAGSANPLEFQGQFEIQADPSSTAGPLQPSVVPVRVIVAAGGPPYSVVSCRSSAAASGGVGTIVTFTTPGTSTFTVPPGITSIFARVVGGGGGGGSGGPGLWGAGGGGAAGYSEGWLTVSSGQNIVVTVGTGGAAGPLGVDPSIGGAGTLSSFGAIQATGGSGGRGSAVSPLGGAGGIGSGGQIGLVGSVGGEGSVAGARTQGGHGGASFFGGGGRSCMVDDPASNALAPGSGGGGGYGPTGITRGGSGAAGAVILNLRGM